MATSDAYETAATTTTTTNRPASASSSSSAVVEIPFWVGGHQKWISGITEATETGDIVKALLQADPKYNHHTDILNKFVLVERWRKVEKPLKNDSKILKIWHAWGSEVLNFVYFLNRSSAVSRNIYLPIYLFIFTK